jgi:hypothetical protein
MMKSASAVLSLLLPVFFLSACAPGASVLPDLRVEGDRWIMPRNAQDPLVWGIRDGIVVGLYPARLSYANEEGGPRGLLRIGYESEGVARFVNFIVITPVRERNGNLEAWGSELTNSPSDNRRGIRFFAYPTDFLDHSRKYPSPPARHLVARISGKGNNEALSFGVLTEVFPNGAQCFLVLTIDGARRTEVKFETYLLQGESDTQGVMISSTWGNLARLRNAYLKGGVENAKDIYPHFHGTGFAAMRFWKTDHLGRDYAGDLIFAAGPDEERPWETKPYPHPAKLLQYFRKTKESWADDLRAMVNGRLYYWKTLRKVPGGVTFENMAIVEQFEQGQSVSFGYYHGEVDDLLEGRASKPIR